MIRSKRVNAYSDNAVLNEYYGLSTDTKPTENVATGSVFIEVDTGATFLYDEEGEDWTEVQSGSSGGGGGGGGDFRNIIQTINIPEQTLTGEEVQPDFYGITNKIGEINTNLPISYDDDYSFVLYSAVDNLISRLGCNFEDAAQMPESGEIISVGIVKMPDSSDIMLMAHSTAPFSININSHTFVIYTANNTVVEAFPDNNLIEAK